MQLKNRLRLLDVAREGDLANAIETCKLYCQHLRSEEVQIYILVYRKSKGYAWH